MRRKWGFWSVTPHCAWIRPLVAAHGILWWKPLLVPVEWCRLLSCLDTDNDGQGGKLVGDLLLITELKLKGERGFLGLLKYEFDVLCRHNMRSNNEMFIFYIFSNEFYFYYYELYYSIKIWVILVILSDFLKVI